MIRVESKHNHKATFVCNDGKKKGVVVVNARKGLILEDKRGMVQIIDGFARGCNKISAEELERNYVYKGVYWNKRKA